MATKRRDPPKADAGKVPRPAVSSVTGETPAVRGPAKTELEPEIDTEQRAAVPRVYADDEDEDALDDAETRVREDFSASMSMPMRVPLETLALETPPAHKPAPPPQPVTLPAPAPQVQPPAPAPQVQPPAPAPQVQPQPAPQPAPAAPPASQPQPPPRNLVVEGVIFVIAFLVVALPALYWIYSVQVSR